MIAYSQDKKRQISYFKLETKSLLLLINKINLVKRIWKKGFPNYGETEILITKSISFVK